ncbi:MAG: glutamate--tRNA ligase [Bacillota bacterium]
MSNVRVRFAPSPTGELHVGGARTALFNYLFVRASGGTFVLRIDDTDLERSHSDYIDKLINAMRWLGLDWDEGPYYQSARLEEYNREAGRLIDGKKAYRCYCSTEELAGKRDAARKDNKTFLYPGTCRNLSEADEKALKDEGREAVIRLFTPDQGTTVVEDMIRGKVSFDNSTLDDFIILKSNGLPTYNFASIVDDLQLEITHVIRAEEHLSNTPRQLLCASALGYELPVFAHVPMILAPDRSKLSKRHGATSVEEFRKEGYLPEALVNYLALLGWSPGGEQEIYSIDDMINLFNLKKVVKTAAVYDVNKLGWMNGHYIREYPLDKLADTAVPFFRERGLLEGELSEEECDYFRQVIESVRERARTLKELAEAADFFYLDHFDYDEKGVKKAFKKEGTAELLRILAEEVKSLEAFNTEIAESLFQSLSERLGLSFGQLILPVRLAVTGKTGGPALFEIMALLGRKRTMERMERAADYIEQHMEQG